MKLDEITSSEVSFHYQVKRLQQEKDLLSEQNEQLSDESNKKSQELLTMNNEKVRCDKLKDIL